MQVIYAPISWRVLLEFWINFQEMEEKSERELTEFMELFVGVTEFYGMEKE